MRNLYIDRLRGLSIAVVLTMHCFIFLPHDFRPIPPDYVASVVRTGYYGVSMFFVISGFLITARVLQRDPETTKSRFSIGAFYAQRLGRIFPCLVLMVTLGFVLSLCRLQGFVIDWSRHSFWQMLNYIFTFRFNRYPAGYTGLPLPWMILWSLSIEEVFYLSFPILFGLLRKPRWIVPVLLLVIGYGPFRRASLPSPFVLYDDFGCFDLIALGSLTALITSALSRFGIHKQVGNALRWTGLAIILFVYLRYPVLQNPVFGPSLIGLGAAFYLLGSIHGTPPGSRQSKILRWPELFGQFSYELYLFHSFVIIAVSVLVVSIFKAWNTVFLSYASLAFAIVVSFVVSAAISKRYSEPANRLIRRILSRPSRPRTPQPLPDCSRSVLSEGLVPTANGADPESR
jgi:peptidoglycan/LPS O-acetylase OafA/YrhL